MGRYSERCAQAKSYITQKELTPKEKEELDRKQKKDTLAKVSLILRKCETLRTPDETRLLEQCSDFVKKISERRERREIYKERVQEKEDPDAVLDGKARKLAEAIRRAKHLICYTGAGISTSARIPDYRGSKGIWTLLAQGKSIGEHDLSLAEPTFTHMALYELHRRNLLRFVVSQNCDGLHLRSGLPRQSLSEVHGNMYVEACKTCKPNVEYWRLFDTTEQTARYNHKTNRRCHFCGSPLVDTIVHFGERGSLQWPLNWAGACKQSEEADCILCLGSSLKVLKKYSWLWAMDRPAKKRPALYIVNLQWTPKDGGARVKVNGKCDDVMRRVMQYLDIEVPAYRREKDPIFVHASLLCHEELHTVSQPMLKAQLDDDASVLDYEAPEESSRMSLASDCSEVEGRRLVEEEKEDIEEGTEAVSRVVSPCESKTVPTDVIALQMRLNRFEEVFQTRSTDVRDNKMDESVELHCNPQQSESSNEDSSHGTVADVKVEPKEEPSDQDLTNKNHHRNEYGTEGVKEEPQDYLSQFLKKKRELEVFLPFTNPIGDVSSFTGCSNNGHITGHSPSDWKMVENGRNAGLGTSCVAQEENETKVKISEAIKTLYKFEPPSLADVVDDTRLTSQPELEKIEEIQMRSIVGGGALGEFLRATATTTSKLLEQIQQQQQQTCSSSAGGGGLSNTANSYYENLLRIYKSLESTLPHWNDPKYAYSGLHSIIHPPPPELNLWGSVVIPIVPSRLVERPPEPACDFCFVNYAELECQFYEPKRTEFQKVSERNGKAIVCECCDYSEEEGEGKGVAEDAEMENGGGAQRDDSELKEEGDVGGESCDELSRTANELNEISNNWSRSENGEPAEKLARPQGGLGQKENGTGKVQAGWYGKGYRKNRQRRRKS